MGADQHIDWNAAAASALDWWQEAGVDTLVDEAPRDWLASVPATGAGAATASAAPAPAPEKPPATLAAFEAWRIGPAAPDAGWGRLIAAEGNAESGLMVLVDMPEREDAASGRLLTGEAGRLFDRMLAAIGRDRQSIYLASLAAARPIAGQIAAEDVAPLAALSRQHIALVKPKRLLMLGNAVSRALLGANAAPTSANLHVLKYDGGQTEAVASFHPRFLLQQPARKAEAWRDLQVLIGGMDA